MQEVKWARQFVAETSGITPNNPTIWDGGDASPIYPVNTVNPFMTTNGQLTCPGCQVFSSNGKYNVIGIISSTGVYVSTFCWLFAHFFEIL
jgi:hypothetical protein